jgi:hypothetical protein
MGDVEGLFAWPSKQVDEAIGREVYFGEILGKHSEIGGTLKIEDLEILSEDQDFIDKLIDIFGTLSISGYNPMLYLEEERN